MPGWCSTATAAATILLREKDPRARDLGRPAPRRRCGAGRARRRPRTAGRRDSTSAMPELLDGQPAVWWPFGARHGHRGRDRRLAGGAARARPPRRRGAGDAARPRPAAGRHAAAQGRRRDRADAPRRARSRPARIAARCASAPTPFAAAPLRCTNTRSRPNCCTSSAATARSGPAYPPIVAAGANACVLHYAAGDATTATPCCAAASCA